MRRFGKGGDAGATQPRAPRCNHLTTAAAGKPGTYMKLLDGRQPYASVRVCVRVNQRRGGRVAMRCDGSGHERAAFFDRQLGEAASTTGQLENRTGQGSPDGRFPKPQRLSLAVAAHWVPLTKTTIGNLPALLRAHPRMRGQAKPFLAPLHGAERERKAQRSRGRRAGRRENCELSSWRHGCCRQDCRPPPLPRPPGFRSGPRALSPSSDGTGGKVSGDGKSCMNYRRLTPQRFESAFCLSILIVLFHL